MSITPIAAKGAVDAELARKIGVGVGGLGNAMNYGRGVPTAQSGSDIPYEKRISGAAEYIKMFGVPESIEFELRDRARYITALDPDIACKTTWSMSVKIMSQRQRQYEREVDRIKMGGWQMRGRETVKRLLGFDWPW